MRILHHAVGLWRLVFAVVILLLLTITGQAQDIPDIPDLVFTQFVNGGTSTVTITSFGQISSSSTIPTGSSHFLHCGLFSA